MSEYRKHYDEQTARKYQQRKPRKDRAEMRLIDRAFALIDKNQRVLDAPCGGGRMLLHLAQAGYTVCGADLSEGMVQIARENLARHRVDCAVERQDLEKLTYPDKHFDTILCFRLFHHFPTPELRQRIIRELCRVAGRNVLLSYFSPLSGTSVYRKVRAALGGRRAAKHATSLAEVAGYFTASGFRLVKDFAQTPLLHTLHLAVFERSAP